MNASDAPAGLKGSLDGGDRRPIRPPHAAIKMGEARIAWTPAWMSDSPTAGQVKVGLRTDDWRSHWSQPFKSWLEAAEDRDFCPGGWLNIGMLFIHFHTLVVRDGVDPRVAHAAFLAIEEYRQRISDDINGSEEAPGRCHGCPCELRDRPIT